MKSTLALAVAVLAVGTKALVGLGDIPYCAIVCLLPLVQNAGCQAVDFPCACSHTEIFAPAAACVYDYTPASGDNLATGCSIEEQEIARPVLIQLCVENGYVIDIPPNTMLSSATATPTATSASTSATSVPTTPTATSASTTATSASTTATSIAPTPTPTGGAGSDSDDEDCIPRPVKCCSKKSRKARKARKAKRALLGY